MKNQYDNMDRLKQTTDPEGATTEYFYYNNGWLQSVFRQVKDSEYAETQYGYDDNGNMNFVSDPMLQGKWDTSHRLNPFIYKSFQALFSKITLNSGDTQAVHVLPYKPQHISMSWAGFPLTPDYKSILPGWKLQLISLDFF